jgi:hypothetical protein
MNIVGLYADAFQLYRPNEMAGLLVIDGFETTGVVFETLLPCFMTTIIRCGSGSGLL